MFLLCQYSTRVLADDVIDFADANVKALCVANWDKNGDGELSETEAAAVTDLGTVFETKEITSFNELQYFTGLTSIGNSAFYYCSRLASITIPGSVTSIEKSAFWFCSRLTSITIPSSVTSIASAAFGGCYGLTSIKVETGNTIYDSRNNCNAIIETATNTLIAGCKNTVIPNSVTRIGTDAFFGCRSLTSITIPSSVTNISQNAFNDCSALTSISVETGNTTYDSRNDCNAIIKTATNTLIAGCKNTIIPNSVTSIGSYAFYSCSGLTSISIPGGVTGIERYAFSDCSALTDITSYIKEPFAIDNNVFQGIPYETATLFVPAGTVDAYKATDGWKNFQNIVPFGEPEDPSVRTIHVAEAGTLSHYITDADKTLLKELTITGQLNGTDFKLLRELTGNNYKGQRTNCIVTKLDLKDASIVKGGENYLETGEINLEFNHSIGFMPVEVTIERNDEMGEKVFIGCKLTEIVLPQNLKYIGTDAFDHCEELSSIVMPEGLVSIGEAAFMQCSKLLSISIPRSVSSIGRYAFAYDNFSSIELPDITVLEECIFYSCSKLTSITIPESVTRIRNSAFDGCRSLTSITIPKGVTDIGYRLFSSCDGLTSIKVDEANPVYDSRNGCNAIIETATNTLIDGIQTTTIPSSVTSIGYEAFYYCSGLTSITIPESVTSIEGDAFYGTAWYSSQPDGLVYAGKVAYKYKGTMPENTEIVLDEGTVGIAGYAFKDFSDLTSIEIPESVTNVGYSAFSGCSSLTKVYCYAEQVPSAKWNAFDGANLTNATLYVPKGSVESYKATSPWNEFGKIEKIPSEANPDVNNNGSVDVGDIMTIINYIADDIYNAEVDLNDDGFVDIGDIMVVINVIIKPQDNSAGVKAMSGLTDTEPVTENNDYLSITNEDNIVSIQLDNEFEYSAFQMLVTLPDGVDIDAVIFNSDRLDGFTKFVKKVNEQQYIIIGFSMNGNVIAGSTGKILSLSTTGNADDNIIISEPIFSIPEAKTYKLRVDDSYTTNLQGVQREQISVKGNTLYVHANNDTTLNIYTVSGALCEQRRLHPGVNTITLRRGQYIINNHKVAISK